MATVIETPKEPFPFYKKYVFEDDDVVELCECVLSNDELGFHQGERRFECVHGNELVIRAVQTVLIRYEES